MATTPRMNRALGQLEARRVLLERQIVAELEQRFFSEPWPEIVQAVIHMGPSARSDFQGRDSATSCGSQFTTTWFAG